MGVLPVCMSVHHVCTVPPEARRGHWIPLNLRYTDNCKLPCECWESNRGPMKKQPMQQRYQIVRGVRGAPKESTSYFSNAQFIVTNALLTSTDVTSMHPRADKHGCQV